MDKFYRGQVYGSLKEIDENNIEKDIYLLVSFNEKPYNVWHCIHSQAGLKKMTHIEVGESLLTTEMEDIIVTEIEKDIEKTKEKKYKINIYSKTDSNYVLELEAKVLTEKIKNIDREMDRLIKNWLENVYQRALTYNEELIKTTNWFERVYTFIKSRQKTNVREIKEIFKMSESLFNRFDYYFEAKSRKELFN